MSAPGVIAHSDTVPVSMTVMMGSAQAYVGAFLQRDSSAAFRADEPLSPEAGRTESDAEPSSWQHGPEVEKAEDNPADALYEIGTFAQVHTVMPGESGAMMLLVGHRRLKRVKTVSSLSRGMACVL